MGGTTKGMKTLDQQIAHALVAARRSASGLIKVTELPTPWQYNLHIIDGHRFTDSHTNCVNSVFRFHNETFNIWSHILGSIFLGGILLYGRSPTSSLHPNLDSSNNSNAANLLIYVYYAYILSAIICTTCSVSWHTFRCISYHDTMSCFSSIDMTGVNTLVIASVLATQLIAFADSAFWQYTYMSVTLILGGAGLIASWLPLMRKPENSWTRVAVWTALIVQGLAMPIVHLFWTRGARRTIEIYSPILPAYVPIGLGAVIYGTKFPECCWPGRFDYLGASHNIWHVASLWGIWLGVGALRNLHRAVERFE